MHTHSQPRAEPRFTNTNRFNRDPRTRRAIDASNTATDRAVAELRFGLVALGLYFTVALVTGAFIGWLIRGAV